MTEAYPLPGCSHCCEESEALIQDIGREFPPADEETPPTFAIGLLAMGFHCLGIMHAQNHPMTLVEYGISMLKV